MRRAVLFDEFAYQCPHFDGEDDDSNGYGCKHKDNDSEGCYCHTCPLGTEAEQEDLTDPEHHDAIKDEIDWDGMCEDGEVSEGEYLLVDVGETQTEEEKAALFAYDKYMHRYDKEWLDEHDIANSLV